MGENEFRRPAMRRRRELDCVRNRILFDYSHPHFERGDRLMRSMLTLLAVVALFPATALKAAENRYASVLIRDVPHVRQKPDFCGEACAEMLLR